MLVCTVSAIPRPDQSLENVRERNVLAWAETKERRNWCAVRALSEKPMRHTVLDNACTTMQAEQTKVPCVYQERF
jgi:hypothetical protein